MFWSSTEALLYPSPPKSWEVALWMKPAEERPSQSFLGSGLLCPTSPNLPNAAKATPKTVHRMRYPKRTPFAVRGCLDQGQLACFVSLTEKVPAPETSMVPCDRRPQGERGEGQVPSGGRDSRRTPATLFSCTHMHVSPPLDPSSVVDVAFGTFFSSPHPANQQE